MENPQAASQSSQHQPSEQKAENWVIFSVTGEDFNPDLVTAELDIEPDRVFYPDEKNSEVVWQLKSTLHGSESLENHMWEILYRLLPVRKNLMKIARDSQLTFHCTIMNPGSFRTAIQISPKLMLLVGHIGAVIDFQFLTSGGSSE